MSSKDLKMSPRNKFFQKNRRRRKSKILESNLLHKKIWLFTLEMAYLHPVFFFISFGRNFLLKPKSVIRFWQGQNQNLQIRVRFWSNRTRISASGRISAENFGSGCSLHPVTHLEYSILNHSRNARPGLNEHKPILPKLPHNLQKCRGNYMMTISII